MQQELLRGAEQLIPCITDDASKVIVVVLSQAPQLTNSLYSGCLTCPEGKSIRGKPTHTGVLALVLILGSKNESRCWKVPILHLTPVHLST